MPWKDGDSTGGDGPMPTARPTGSTSCSTRPGWPCGGRTCRTAGDAPARLVATDLRRGRGEQLTLFDPPDPQRDAVAAAKAAVNARFGRFKVRSGATLYLPAVYADPANDFDICDVRGKVCF